MKYIYPAFFYEELEGGYSVLFPDFPCCTCGDTVEEAHYMAVDFLYNQISYLLDENQSLPAPSDIKNITPESPSDEWQYKNVFSTLVAVDINEYQKYLEEQNKTVRKNVTIPKWIDDLAQKHHINFSSVLQEALKIRLNI